MSHLFSPLKIRKLEFRNRIFVSPMCQYSAVNGVPNNWHLVHLGSRAVGGAGLVMAEATGIVPEGRISPGCTGLWNEEQVKAFTPIAEFIRAHGAVPAIQLAHAGRKASTPVPWAKGPLSHEEAWVTRAPSAIPFRESDSAPQALTRAEIDEVPELFLRSAKLALTAGFQVIELHMAHGYLLHEFLSPLTNLRNDDYGGTLENRMRLPLAVAASVRKLWPQDWPVFVRVSATDWAEGGWDVDQTVEFAKKLSALGIDLLDCSSGGNVPHAKIPAGPGYQVPFAAEIRTRTGMKTGAVGMITEPEQAEQILREEKADVIFIARELLRDPYWPLHAAQKLGVDVSWPKQYDRAKNPS